MPTYNLVNDDVISRCCAEIRASKGMSVKIAPMKRSLDQNSLYHALVGIIAKEIGETPDDLHEQLKVRFLGVEEKEVWGKKLIVPKSTASLSKADFGNLIDKVYALGSNLSIKLPSPSHYGM